MTRLSDALDELAVQAAAMTRHPRHCRCNRCRRDWATLRQADCGCDGSLAFDEGAIRRRLRPAGRQTRPSAVGPQLPLWRGWSSPVSLKQIMDARAGAIPMTDLLRRFFVRGNQVYRITRSGIDRIRPLNIGATKDYKSIADRVIEHYTTTASGTPRGDPRVYAKIGHLPAERVAVQAAIIVRRDPHPRRANLYEGWLQDRERPLLYNRTSTSFDEAARRNPAPWYQEA